MRQLFISYTRLFRLSGLIGFSINPLFGALSLVQIGVHVNPFVLFLLLLLGVMKSIHGNVMNDLFDIEVDKLSRNPNQRPLVTGEISTNTAVIISFLTVLFTFGIVFAFFFRYHPSFYYAVFFIIIGAIVGNIYNKYGKRFVGSDFLVGFSEAIFVFVGAFLISPDGNLSIFTLVICLLVFNQYLFMNMIVGGIKDADHDYLLKVKNIAIKTGVKITENKNVHLPISFVSIGLFIRFCSAFLIFVPFIFFDVFLDVLEFFIIFFTVLIVLILTFRILTLRNLADRKKLIGLFAIQGVLRYCFIPFLLIPIIGFSFAILLVLLPIIWFLIITLLFGHDIAPNL
jgi:4-hydroxybenzoate polyprenyltransferase